MKQWFEFFHITSYLVGVGAHLAQTSAPLGASQQKQELLRQLAEARSKARKALFFFLVVPLVDPRFFVELAARFSQILKTARYNSKGVDSPVVFFRRIVFYRFFVQRFET